MNVLIIRGYSMVQLNVLLISSVLKKRIRISRIICKECGKTHVIFIEAMIHFSCLNRDDLISVLESHYLDFTDPSHFYYLKNKLSDINFKYYRDICLFQTRNIPVIFIYSFIFYSYYYHVKLYIERGRS